MVNHKHIWQCYTAFHGKWGVTLSQTRQIKRISTSFSENFIDLGCDGLGHVYLCPFLLRIFK